MSEERSSVLCALCRFENERRCMKKNSKVKINKTRHCKDYVESEEKLNILMVKDLNKSNIETIVRPDRIFDGKHVKVWDGKKYKRDRAMEERALLKSGGVDISPGYSGTTLAQGLTSNVNDPAHPLTGDLSRFTSTSSDKN